MRYHTPEDWDEQQSRLPPDDPIYDKEFQAFLALYFTHLEAKENCRASWAKNVRRRFHMDDFDKIYNQSVEVYLEGYGVEEQCYEMSPCHNIFRLDMHSHFVFMQMSNQCSQVNKFNRKFRPAALKAMDPLPGSNKDRSQMDRECLDIPEPFQQGSESRKDMGRRCINWYRKCCTASSRNGDSITSPTKNTDYYDCVSPSKSESDRSLFELLYQCMQFCSYDFDMVSLLESGPFQTSLSIGFTIFLSVLIIIGSGFICFGCEKPCESKRNSSL